MLAVHGEREDVWISGKDKRGSVTLMNVQIDHSRFLDTSLGPKRQDSDRNVVENTEP